MWDRLNAPARHVMADALDAADELGHDYIGDEHVLLGLLGEESGSARRFLERHGLDRAAARTELLRLTVAGQIPRPRRDQAADLRTVGIDVDQVARRLTAAFGPDAVGRAVWRASRRPWWRGGGRRRTPLCGKPLAAKRALALAADYADSRGRGDVGPEELLYGVLRDAADPFGTGLSRRGRKQLTQLGWNLGGGNPAAAILAARGLDPGRLQAELSADSGTER
jgi:ATP-dependent Clp protease ATP-binding subunit ClpA